MFLAEILYSLTFMKKIKYGNRKNEPSSKQIDNLKQGDEICEAVLDTLSDDYLNYITHLVKHSKTPTKHAATKVQEPHLSQSLEKIEEETLQKVKPQQAKADSKIRHHSESGTRKASYSVVKQQIDKKIGKGIPEDPTRKLNYKKNKQIHKDQKVDQIKSKTIQEYEDLLLKNEQKTMSFTRNNPKFANAMRLTEEDIHTGGIKKQLKAARPKYYTTYYQQEDSQKISINDELMPERRNSQRQNISNTFISEIDNYISNLESNNHKKQSRYCSKQRKERYKKESSSEYEIKIQKGSRHSRSKRQIQQEEFEYNLQQILKQNLKLSKKVKSYQIKVQELEDEISTHLIQCKNREKNYKNKIAELVKALTNSISKINNQKAQISSMKTILRSFGQKFKQIQLEHEDESDDQISMDLSEEIHKFTLPSRHKSQLRTKYKKGLDSTMPKQDQERKFWKE